MYLAEDPGIQRQIAVKVMRTEIATYPETEMTKRAARLFQCEVQAIAHLDHPSILPLYDYGEQKVNGITLTYLVMPYRQEGSLANWLHQRESNNVLSLQDIVSIVQQAASALQYAHDHQIIHQDVKPTNFLVRPNNDSPACPDLLLTDFGIAKLDTFTSSMSQNIQGTPTYMAPEQCEGHSVSATDQYALAVMVYELLTGRPPYRGSAMQIMYAHVHIPPHPPSHVNPHVARAVDAVILRALEKKPEDRYPSISAFATAFQQALQGVDTSSTLSLTLSVVATPQGSMVPSLRIAEIGEQQTVHNAAPVPDERGVPCTTVLLLLTGENGQLSSGSLSFLWVRYSRWLGWCCCSCWGEASSITLRSSLVIPGRQCNSNSQCTGDRHRSSQCSRDCNRDCPCGTGYDVRFRCTTHQFQSLRDAAEPCQRLAPCAKLDL